MAHNLNLNMYVYSMYMCIAHGRFSITLHRTNMKEVMTALPSKYLKHSKLKNVPRNMIVFLILLVI